MGFAFDMQKQVIWILKPFLSQKDLSLQIKTLLLRLLRYLEVYNFTLFSVFYSILLHNFPSETIVPDTLACRYSFTETQNKELKRNVCVCVYMHVHTCICICTFFLFLTYQIKIRYSNVCEKVICIKLVMKWLTKDSEPSLMIKV